MTARQIERYLIKLIETFDIEPFVDKVRDEAGAECDADFDCLPALRPPTPAREHRGPASVLWRCLPAPNSEWYS
jgi:hypothetical protein